MRYTSIVSTGVVISAVMLAGSVGIAQTFGTPRVPATHPVPRAAGLFTARAGAATARKGAAHRIRHNVPTCSTAGSNSFVGVTGTGNVAGGIGAAVLGGDANGACDEDSAVGGGSNNGVGGGNATSAFLGGGDFNAVTGTEAFLGAGNLNTASALDAFVGAGFSDTAAGSGSFVGSGNIEYETVAASGESGFTQGAGNFADGTDSFVGAGDLNDIVSTGNGSFIGAGGYVAASRGVTSENNTISADDSFIGAGDANAISGAESFIGSGGNNAIGSAASYGSILGGNHNNVTGEYASIIGGFGNTASGSYAIVAGGDADTAAGTLTFAAGYHADAAHNGSFVWSDYVSGSTAVKDTVANEFVARASGGTVFLSNEAGTSGVKLAAGSGTWANLSDRNAKTDIASLDDAAVLEKVAELPVKTWRYASESGVRHVGPMAQDFYAAFGVGEDDRHITSIDEDGVALAAIKALHRENTDLHRENDDLRGELHRLEAVVASRLK